MTDGVPEIRCCRPDLDGSIKKVSENGRKPVASANPCLGRLALINKDLREFHRDRQAPARKAWDLQRFLLRTTGAVQSQPLARKGRAMSINRFFAKASFIAMLIVALCGGVSLARGGGGGGGGGHGGGGFGGGGFHGGGGGWGGAGFRGGGWGGGGYRGGWGGGYGVAMRAGSFSSIAPSHAFSGGEFGRAGTGREYGGRYGNFAGNHEHGDYFRRGGYGGYGGWWPWFGGWGLGWGLGWGWGYPYDYDYGYYYPDAGDYYYSYAPAAYYDNGAVVDSGVPATDADNLLYRQPADIRRRNSVLFRCASSLSSGRLSKRPAAGGHARRRAESQGP